MGGRRLNPRENHWETSVVTGTAQNRSKAASSGCIRAAPPRLRQVVYLTERIERLGLGLTRDRRQRRNVEDRIAAMDCVAERRGIANIELIKIDVADHLIEVREAARG